MLSSESKAHCSNENIELDINEGIFNHCKGLCSLRLLCVIKRFRADYISFILGI